MSFLQFLRLLPLIIWGTSLQAASQYWGQATTCNYTLQQGHAEGIQSVCTVTAYAGPDQTVCGPGAMVTLMGSFTGNVIGQEWSPPDGLSDPTSLNPTVFVSATTTFTLTVFEDAAQGPNLVLNGDFSLGNTGFGTGYTFVPDDPADNMELFPEGTYTVIGNSSTVHPDFSACSDHTGGGNMMVVNGSAALQSVW